MGRKKLVTVEPIAEDVVDHQEAQPQDSPVQQEERSPTDQSDHQEESLESLQALFASLTDTQRVYIYKEQKKKRDREYQREYYAENHEKMKNRGKEKYHETKDVKVRAESGKRSIGRPRLEI